MANDSVVSTDSLTSRYFVGDIVQKRGHFWKIVRFLPSGNAIGERESAEGRQTINLALFDPGTVLVRPRAELPSIERLVDSVSAGDQEKASLLNSFLDAAFSQGLIVKR